MRRTPAARVAAAKGSAIRRVFEAARTLEREGVAITHMEIGRPDFDTPAHIKAAAADALARGEVHYTANAGLAELREAIADKLRTDNGLRVDPQREVIVTVGAKEAVFITLGGLLDEGDEFIVPTPTWPDYLQTAALVGGRPVPVPLGPGHQIDPDAVEAAVTPRTKLLLVLTPHNPTGAVAERATLEVLSEIAARHDLLVVSDEIYEKLVYDGAAHISFATLPGMAERTLTINGFSKAYSMTGWRLGYVAGPAGLIGALMKMHQSTTNCAVTFAQWGGVAAYRGDQGCVAEMAREFDRRRRLVMDALRRMPGVRCVEPRGAFYAFPDFSALGRSDVDLAEDLLRRAHVALVPGSAFGPGGEGHLRIAYSTGYDALAAGLARMAKAVEELASERTPPRGATGT